MFVFSSINQRTLFRFSLLLFFISLFFLLLVPLIGIEVKGSKRWIELYMLPRFQPIELVKPFLIISISLILSSEKYSNLYFKYFLSFSTTLIVALFLVLQPDIGQTLLVIFSWLILVFTSGINIVFLLILFFISVFLISYLIIFVPKFYYIKSRLISFFDKEIGTHNFQSDKAIESIISGGFFGKGVGEGILKNRVPEAHTDYIISVISEEFGVIAIILILLLFIIFIYSVFKKVYFENEEKIKLILVGCISLILMQTIISVSIL